MKYVFGIYAVVGIFVFIGAGGLAGCGPVDIKDVLPYIVGGLLAALVGTCGLIKLETEY